MDLEERVSGPHEWRYFALCISKSNQEHARTYLNIKIPTDEVIIINSDTEVHSKHIALVIFQENKPQLIPLPQVKTICQTTYTHTHTQTSK